MRPRSLPILVALTGALFAIGCKGADQGTGGNEPAFLANASAEARQALAAPVSFQLTEDNYAKWEEAQRNLDRIPVSEFSGSELSGGNVIDRAVTRLEASSRAKRAIESAGLSVRDFVLETVALAQAVRASQGGSSALGPDVSAANFAFVERFRERIRQERVAGELARQSGDSPVTDVNTAAELEAANADRIADSLSRASDSLDAATGRSRDASSAADSARSRQRDTLNIRLR